MNLVRLPVSPSADDLQQEWLSHLGQLEQVSQRSFVRRLLPLLSAPPPGDFADLLALRPYQIIKKRRLQQYYPSLQLFVWQKALEQAQPPHAARLVRLLKRTLAAQSAADQRRVDTIEGHLALFVLLTDHFLEEGFLSVAHQVVLRVLGDVDKYPTHLLWAVQLADYLDNRFEQDVIRFSNMDIVP